MAEPIRPDQVADLQEKTIPEAVIETFNKLIAQNYVNGYATVKQDDVVKILVDQCGLDRHEIFDKGWLNIEDIYRKAHWKVEYDKPGYNEDYPATFKFSKKKS